MISENLSKSNKALFISFDNAVKLMKDEVDKVLSTSPLIIREYTEHLMKSKGKYIRALSLITCAENSEGLIHVNAVKFGAAIEILHLATLVHDDVIDNAKKRRGVVTLQKKFGKKTAVICGDYLLCVSLKLAASIENKSDYLNFDMPQYMERVCMGELTQHINNRNLDLTFYQYFKIISGKTAALFEASFFSGAVLCEEESRIVKKYKKLGHYIGMIFQLTDDCMDFETTEIIAKKPVQSDFEQGVITLPLIYALNHMAGFKEKVKSGDINREDINKAVDKTGGLNITRIVSKKYYDKALKIINELEISITKKENLIAILDKAFHR